MILFLTNFGCYSYSANADMEVIVTRRFLNEDEKSFEKKDNTDYLKQLKPADLKLLLEVKTNLITWLVFVLPVENDYMNLYRILSRPAIETNQ